MNQLHIYPTSRALRTVSSQHKEQDGFLPALMRMDEFEHRAILIENKIQIDPLQRILLLREAASFQALEDLKLNLELVRFFTKSDALFKFFEELAGEQISFEILAQADAYAEFETHLAILERLLENYRNLLDAQGFTDKAFIPSSYRLNEGFLEIYDTIEIHLEGYLSHFELELLENVAQQTQLTIHYTTSKFNMKMQERFESMGIVLPNHKHVSFSMTDKKVISAVNNDIKINAKVYSVEEKEEQIALAFTQIEHIVNDGIAPEEIVLILPDESFKEHFTLFDTHNNLNFAMGYDYSKGRIYKSLEALYGHWQNFDSDSKYLLERYGFNLEEVEKLTPTKQCSVEVFFSLIDRLKLLDTPLKGGEKKEKYSAHVQEKYLHFLKIFDTQALSQKEWLFLWLKALSKITIDDVRGGMITVMGVLETRGVSFEGVVIVDFNEGIVPATSSKDQFLNSSVRAFANLPTKNDREALQKQYYKRLLEQAQKAVILYSTSDNKLPSKFLYELGLETTVVTQAQLNLLYNQPLQLTEEKDPVVEQFNAHDIVWSASKLKTYLECKRKYYYRYIQKIQAKPDDELNEGAFLHSLLDHLHREKDSYDSKEEMKKGIDILLDKLLPFDDAKIVYQKLLWKEKLKGFVSSQIEHFNADWKVVEREKEFQGDIGGLRFKGRIDRIDQNATDTLVLDYKSGQTKEANKTKNLEKLTDFQMSIYQQMLKSKYQNINLAFLKIFENGEVEEITVLEEKNELLFEHIIELKQTKSFVASKCEDLQKCKYCEFTLMCERGEYL
ncbi:RecB family exonuclease [Sulfurovum sp. CS9]|uniref:PD-(D/E)XK nuclease family protein n=1 Tax=Sulfurovum sp. CS9 TaxID=3391146 RepID=UPI0039EA3A3D